MVRERPDLKPYEGRKLTVIAWLWARTVKSPNPAFAEVDVPLASTFMLSTKNGKEAYVEPVIDGREYRFAVKVGTPPDAAAAKAGTGAGKRHGFRCLISRVPVTYHYIRSEGQGGAHGRAADGHRRRRRSKPSVSRANWGAGSDRQRSESRVETGRADQSLAGTHERCRIWTYLLRRPLHSSAARRPDHGFSDSDHRSAWPAYGRTPSPRGIYPRTASLFTLMAPVLPPMPRR